MWCSTLTYDWERELVVTIRRKIYHGQAQVQIVFFFQTDSHVFFLWPTQFVWIGSSMRRLVSFWCIQVMSKKPVSWLHEMYTCVNIPLGWIATIHVEAKNYNSFWLAFEIVDNRSATFLHFYFELKNWLVPSSRSFFFSDYLVIFLILNI